MENSGWGHPPTGRSLDCHYLGGPSNGHPDSPFTLARSLFGLPTLLGNQRLSLLVIQIVDHFLWTPRRFGCKSVDGWRKHTPEGVQDFPNLELSPPRIDPLRGILSALKMTPRNRLRYSEHSRTESLTRTEAKGMLTVDDYGAIRRAHRDGMPIKRIALEFEHSRNTIRKILKHPEPNPIPGSGIEPLPSWGSSSRSSTRSYSTTTRRPQATPHRHAGVSSPAR